MINLLPPEEKKKLFLKKIKRLLVIWGTIILAILFCLILVLISIDIYIRGGSNSQKIILEQVKKGYDSSDTKSLQNIIKGYNESLLGLKNFYGKNIYLSKILEKVSEIPRPGIYFTNLSLIKPSESPKKDEDEVSQDNRIELTISGFSKTRENLSLFKKELENEEGFQDVYFYPASWIKPTDVDFHLTLKVKLLNNSFR